MIIRQENNKDHNEIYNLVKEAFKTAEHSDGNEQDLVIELRKGDAYIPELSLVAEVDEKIAGQIMFSKAKIGDKTVIVLAPLSILPKFQRKGIGSALIQEAHKIAKDLKYQYSLVLGSEKYYPSFGYVPAELFGIEVPEGIPPENFMAIKLLDNADEISGAVVYAKEFGM